MQWIRAHASLLTLITGSCVITAWTLLRFFTKPIVYDLLGQQVLASQWLGGFVSGSVTGPTNYIMKILFVYMPLSALHVDPKIELITTAICINIATYVCLFFVIRHTIKLLNIKTSGFFYAAMLWIAAAAGSLFWIQFSNSRNLEVAGGALLLLLGLRFIQKPTRTSLVGLSIFAALLFFADPLQLYMTASGLVVYAVVLLFMKRLEISYVIELLLAFAVAFCLASLLTLVVSHFFSVTFAGIGSFSQYFTILSHPLQAIKETALANIRLVSGTYDTGRLSQIINLVIISVAVIFTFFLALKRRLPKQAVIFIATMAVIIELVYIASGQALLGGDTSRYLIMLLPLLVLIVSLTTYLGRRTRQIFKGFIVVGLLINIGLLGYTLSTSWTSQLPGESHITSVVNYLDSHDFTYGYASIDTSIPATYFYADSNHLLPLGCSSNTFVKDNLFYDKAAYAHTETLPSQGTAIFLDADSITNAPNVCLQADIIKQFGQPDQTDKTSDNSIVDIFYNQTSVKNRLQYSQ